MGTKIFAKVGLAVLLLTMPAFSNEMAAAPDSAIHPASYCIPDPDPNNERPGGGGKSLPFSLP